MVEVREICGSKAEVGVREESGSRRRSQEMC